MQTNQRRRGAFITNEGEHLILLNYFVHYMECEVMIEFE